jgi:hypothetical protein
MATNLLKALLNLAKYQDNDLKSIYKGSNRANIMGEALEYYAKDLFCDCLGEKDIDKKDRKHSQYFSYIGNQNNPPDFIIKQGDAIEVKKIESFGSSLALNSSYPKAKLYSDSPMITVACKDCEKWERKDIIYTVGVIKDAKVRLLWFVYGDCYAADKEVYERIRKAVVGGIKEIKDVALSETDELGRVNKVDPLGITYLRIRGMWAIENPIKVFDYVVKERLENNFTAYAIIKVEKYNSFAKEDRDKLEAARAKKKLAIEDIKIKNPNNPAQYLPVKLIKVAF